LGKLEATEEFADAVRDWNSTLLLTDRRGGLVPDKLDTGDALTFNLRTRNIMTYPKAEIPRMKPQSILSNQFCLRNPRAAN
jgi:hypothetical protein